MILTKEELVFIITLSDPEDFFDSQREFYDMKPSLTNLYDKLGEDETEAPLMALRKAIFFTGDALEYDRRAFYIEERGNYDEEELISLRERAQEQEAKASFYWEEAKGFKESIVYLLENQQWKYLLPTTRPVDERDYFEEED